MTNNLKYYADALLGESVFVPKTPFVESTILSLAEGVYNSPVNTRQRTMDEVIRDSKNIVIEFAMIEVDPNLIRNPLKFDFKNPHSHAYDVLDIQTKATFEVKRWRKNTVWFSYPERALSNLLKHIDLVDYVVSGEFVEHNDSYEVKFKMIADAKSFERYCKKSMYNTKDLYYNHHHAVKAGVCYMSKENV